MRIPAKQPDIKVLPVKLTPARFPIGIATLKNRTLNPVARLAINTVREAARPLRKGK